MKYALNQWTLYKGQANQIGLVAIDETGCPITTSGALSAKLKVKNKDGSILEIETGAGFTMGQHPAVTVWTFDLTADQIEALPTGKLDAFLKVSFTGFDRIWVYPQSITVWKSPI